MHFISDRISKEDSLEQMLIASMATPLSSGYTDTGSLLLFIPGEYSEFLFYCMVSSLSLNNKNKLNKIVNMCNKIASKQHHSMTILCES